MTFSAHIRSATEKESLHLVWESYSLYIQLSYVAQRTVVELLTLPARSIESIVHRNEDFRFMFFLERFRECLRDHVHSIVSGHVLWFQSVEGIKSWACKLVQHEWPLQLSWSACEQKPKFHFITKTLELARLGTRTPEVGRCSACLFGSDIRDSTTTDVNSSSAVHV